MAVCPSCGAGAPTPLACGACGALLAPESPPTPFEVFGLEPAYAVDRAVLRKGLLEQTRRMHPDYFGTDDEQRALAERNTASLNEAFEVLDDDFARADWLVRSRGGPGENEERQMPQEFLMEVLEWNETLEEARASGAGGAELDELERTLTGERERTFSELAAALTPLPETGAPALLGARRLLNAARYLDKTLREIAALRLARASST